jgi:hypothetical protein
MATKKGRRTALRVQTGVRMERRIFGVLKAVADLHGISLGDLLEGLALHAFDGKLPFGPDARKKIGALREAFGLDLRAEDSHLLRDRTLEPKARVRPETAKEKVR